MAACTPPLHVWEPGIEPADRKEPRTSDMKHKESDTDRGGKVEAKEKQENEAMQKGREKQIWNKSHRCLQTAEVIKGKVEPDGRWPRPCQHWALI